MNAFLLVFLTTIIPSAVVAQATQRTQPGVVEGVTAHRGYSAAYPENTMPAFKAGIAIRADWVELDIHRTKDGQLVVIHDKTTGRTGDKDLVVAEATYEELLEVDVATDFRKLNGRTLEKCPAHRIPLLADVLTLIMGQQETRLSIQPKVDCVDDAVTLIKQLNATSMVGFNDGNLAFMSMVKELAPEIPVFWDRPPSTDIDENIKIAREKGFESLVINYRGITPEKITKIKSAQLAVGAWTVNDETELVRLLKMGVDRIYTDDPMLLIANKKAHPGL